jgi:hypothetical protein
MKRGQVAVFIIVGIILGFSVVAMFLLKDLIETPKAPAFASEVYDTIESCLEETTDTSLKFILLQGGNYKSSDSNFFQIYRLAGPIENGNGTERTNYSFTKKDIAFSTETLLNRIFKSCIEEINLSTFAAEVILEDFNLEVEAENKRLTTTLDMPTTIKKGNISLYKDEFIYEKDINIRIMEEIVNNIIDGSIATNGIPHEIIENYKQKEIAEIDWFLLGDEYIFDTAVYMAYLPDEDYMINFVIKYDWTEDE